ncbi:hypothetical protein N1851_035182 [Merluccius polli]|uniref:Uncharacterized protein n=1 Tax=Merluccius polli TaxID=89951 RepID=A0AA47NLC8_MERPO|nr:hypothetical protein N1851_035182 [Merluccius polli]
MTAIVEKIVTTGNLGNRPFQKRTHRNLNPAMWRVWDTVRLKKFTFGGMLAKPFRITWQTDSSVNTTARAEQGGLCAPVAGGVEGHHLCLYWGPKSWPVLRSSGSPEVLRSGFVDLLKRGTAESTLILIHQSWFTSKRAGCQETRTTPMEGIPTKTLTIGPYVSKVLDNRAYVSKFTQPVHVLNFAMATLEELTAEPKSGSGQPSMSLHEEPSPGQPSMSLHEESSPGQPSMSLHEEPSPGQPSMSLHEEPSPGQPSMSLHEESSPGQPSMSLHEEPSPGQPSMSLHEESSSGQPSMSLHESSPGQPSMSLHESSSGQASMGLHEEPSSGQPSMSLHQPSPGQPSMSLHQPSCGQASMSLHEPSSEQSQDISHVLANIFKDAYTKEIIGETLCPTCPRPKTA